MGHRPDSLENVAQARFSALLDAAVDAIIVIDSHGVIETLNKAAEQMFGYEPNTLPGRNVSDLMPEPYRAEHDGYIEHYRDTGEKKIIGIGREVRGLRANGEVFPLDLSVGDFRDSGDQKFVGILRDISNRKQTEKTLRQQQERLEHVMRLGTLGEMAAGIAHEVNQPLTAIATYARAASRLISSGQMENDRLLEILEKTSGQAERAGQVIRRIRNLARKQTSNRERHDLADVVLDALRLAEIDARLHDVQLDFHAAENLPEAWVDPVQIQQVVLNLVRNSIEAVPSASRIVVKTQSNDPEEVIVEISDNGPGISNDVLSEIFNPFFTTKNAGTGLGLSISRSIVAHHGGRLEARNNDGAGATFSIILPTAVSESDDE